MPEIIAELATGHGGDVGLAEAMLFAAAEAGANTVKTQAYSLEKLNPRDPQADWLRQSYLPLEAHQRLMLTAQQAGVSYLVTPFDADSLTMLRGVGLTRFKVASSESGNDWWETKQVEQWFVSYPWGAVAARLSPFTFKGVPVPHDDRRCIALTAIPLYPTPLECVGKAKLLNGWSDHCEGISACQWAIAKGAKVIEVHFTIPGSRHLPFDKTAEDLRRLRAFADDCQTISSGVATKFRNRWTA